jgi:hypothetical protein
MAKKVYKVEVPTDYKIRTGELNAAQILAKHYKSNITFLSQAKGYKEKSADFIIKDIRYELKSPITSSINSLEKLIRIASKQSENVVMDIRKSKITEKRMIELCKDRLKNIKRLKKIVLIVNNKKILEFTK